MADVTYTHPDVLTRGVREGWAEAETDPTRIDWAERQARAAVPFKVVNGRPVNPGGPTGIRFGRNRLGFWGEQLMADAVVTVHSEDSRWLAMVLRRDGNGWAIPGGKVDPGETPLQAAIRELMEEATLDLSDGDWRELPARHVPDPRESDEAWATTVPARIHLGTMRREDFPVLKGADDAKRAEWVRADTSTSLVTYLADTYKEKLFAAHVPMVRELFG